MKCRVCLNYILDVPDKDLYARETAEKIADDAKWLIDQYARESYCSMVETVGEDE
ncbi:hypothetical protein [Collinsella bouchesdurhonensis]|uniref:hypothetical protein n=1 Tax=Collinsella bouchesdurhonensis TaxID=1907654 RepID=UPI0034A38E74